jgi:hypothetical protein
MTQAELCYAAAYVDMKAREFVDKTPNYAVWGLSPERAAEVRAAADNGTIDFSPLPAHLRPDAHTVE